MEVLNFTVLGDTFKGHYAAISKIDEKQFIFVSSTMKGTSFVYNYETGSRTDIQITDPNNLLCDNIKITDKNCHNFIIP